MYVPLQNDKLQNHLNIAFDGTEEYNSITFKKWKNSNQYNPTASGTIEDEWSTLAIKYSVTNYNDPNISEGQTTAGVNVSIMPDIVNKNTPDNGTFFRKEYDGSTNPPTADYSQYISDANTHNIFKFQVNNLDVQFPTVHITGNVTNAIVYLDVMFKQDALAPYTHYTTSFSTGTYHFGLGYNGHYTAADTSTYLKINIAGTPSYFF